jgi:hypothetical protein
MKGQNKRRSHMKKILIAIAIMLLSTITYAGNVLDLNGEWKITILETDGITPVKVVTVQLVSDDSANDAYSVLGVDDGYWMSTDLNQHSGYIDTGRYSFSLFCNYTLVGNKYKGKAIIWDWSGLYPQFRFGRFVMKKL